MVISWGDHAIAGGGTLEARGLMKVTVRKSLARKPSKAPVTEAQARRQRMEQKPKNPCGVAILDLKSKTPMRRRRRFTRSLQAMRSESSEKTSHC